MWWLVGIVLMITASYLAAPVQSGEIRGWIGVAAAVLFLFGSEQFLITRATRSRKEKDEHPLKSLDLVMTGKDNCHSLFRLQIYIWTLWTVIAFVQAAFASAILPAFHQNVAILLGINGFTAMLSAAVIDTSKLHDKSSIPPSFFKDIFPDNKGRLDMARTQMFVWSIVKPKHPIHTRSYVPKYPEKLTQIKPVLCNMKTLAFSLLTVIMISLGPLSCPTFGQIEKIFELQQGVVVDLGRGLMFVMNPKGGIDAIDIGKGTLVWHSNEAAKPLILQGDLLICQGEPAAQTNVLDIVILQTQQNGGRKSAFAINLPQSVQVSIDERLTDTFIVGAHLFGDKVVISWEYKPRPEWARGVRDTSVSNMPSRRNSVIRGTFRLDPSTGATSHLPTERISPSVGGQILKTSERLTEVVGPQYFSANANHILGTKKIANSSEWNKYRWTIYSRTDGKKIGEVGMHVSWAPFFALDSTIICRTPPYSRLINGKLVSQEARVRAINLRTGNEIWSWPIRDTKFRGPFPN